MAYADSSTKTKWLKTVDRKKRWPIPRATVRFKISSFTLDFEKERKNTFQLLKLHLGKFFLNTLSIFLSFNCFLFFTLKEKNWKKKISILFRIWKNSSRNWLWFFALLYTRDRKGLIFLYYWLWLEGGKSNKPGKSFVMFGYSWCDMSVLGSQVFWQAWIESCDSF